MGVLRQHLRTHTGVKEFECNVCHAQFTTNGSLTRHAAIHATKPFKCPFCLDAFRTASSCKKHMEIHANGGNRGFVCAVERCCFAEPGLYSYS
ncbi:hypothetical protein DPMN_175934 [Dreissena polymorpha]|uniref:C2H2-type domain-containing protein n=1 Tax=Dreissena polymorpha TaxID=45954 RepID=A0A9D4E626_DREPO|nr:hypothetical protein DPMN_175934 [Dreissena polymorpha]